MSRILAIAVLLATFAFAAEQAPAQNLHAYGRAWGGTMKASDWNRLYHYPYVFYPQNYWRADYFRSAPNMYYRYTPEMRIPVYNTGWYNEYPSGREYHSGHHFILDVF